MLAVAVCGCHFSPHKKLSDRLLSDRMREFAQTFEASGQEDQAIKFLKRSIKKSPGNLVAHEQLADVYLKTGQPELAAMQLEQAIAGTTERHQLHIKLGRLYLDLRKTELAGRQAELAIKMDMAQAQAWELAGDVHVAKSELSQAVNAYQRALSLTPKDPTVCCKLCELHLKMEQPLRALATLEQLNLNESPHETSPEIMLLHGIVLTEMKNYRQAIAILRKACDHHATSSAAYLRLSNVLLLDGRENEAREILLAGQQRFPDLPIFSELLTLGSGPLRPSMAARD